MRSIVVFLIFILTMPAFSWGQTGHRVTGAIAEKYLTDEARAAVRVILGVETLAEASTWPDEQRSNPADFWQNVAGPYHYLTVPEGEIYNPENAPTQGDAYKALKRFTATLKDPQASLEDKQLALRFVVHIIGDLHQPLHVGNGTDRGGNDVKLQWYGIESNLHRVWDSGLINKQQLSYTEWTEWLSAKITDEQANEWADPDPLTWIMESAAIRDTIYPEGKRLSWQYNYDHIDTVKRRLSQGGVRIAAYLNQIFMK